MPLIFELFGYPLNDRSPIVEESRKKAWCPFTASGCDGGGNRYQTAIKLPNAPELRRYFDDEIERVVPGVCSIDYGDNQWIVCPRRLMGFKHDGEGLPDLNAGLQAHERDLLLRAGLPADTELGVWREVYLRFSTDELDINYHFDFVIAPLARNVRLEALFAHSGVSAKQEQDELVSAARRGGLLSGRVNRKTQMAIVPKLERFLILEIMTASTSGSDTAARTDIASSFTDAILGKPHESPGINKRQVWGRMTTQLFAKSALAEGWGGKTLWVVQDELIADIANTQKLSIEHAEVGTDSTINFAWMHYGPSEDGVPRLQLTGYKEIASGLDFGEDRTGTCADILVPKRVPPKYELLKAILRSSLAARLNL